VKEPRNHLPDYDLDSRQIPMLARESNEFAFRVQRRSRSGRIADTTRRTGHYPASFRPLDGTISRMSMRRKAQEMRLP
jgi:hypothetical protein